MNIPFCAIVEGVIYLDDDDTALIEGLPEGYYGVEQIVGDIPDALLDRIDPQNHPTFTVYGPDEGWEVSPTDIQASARAFRESEINPRDLRLIVRDNGKVLKRALELLRERGEHPDQPATTLAAEVSDRWDNRTDRLLPTMTPVFNCYDISTDKWLIGHLIDGSYVVEMLTRDGRERSVILTGFDGETLRFEVYDSDNDECGVAETVDYSDIIEIHIN